MFLFTLKIIYCNYILFIYNYNFVENYINLYKQTIEKSNKIIKYIVQRIEVLSEISSVTL